MKTTQVWIRKDDILVTFLGDQVLRAEVYAPAIDAMVPFTELFADFPALVQEAEEELSREREAMGIRFDERRGKE